MDNATPRIDTPTEKARTALAMGEWISVEQGLPEEKFIGLNRRQGNNQIMGWWDPVHKRYLYTGGKYYGDKKNPGFTDWMRRNKRESHEHR